AIARAIPEVALSGSVVGAVGASLWEVVGSAVVGVVVGIALGYAVKYARGGDELLVIVLGAVLLASGVAGRMHVSPLITCLVVGATVSNLVIGSRKLFATVDRFAPPVYVILFCLAGVGFAFDALFEAGTLFVGYVISRALGKLLGVSISARLLNAGPEVSRYLGVSLLPQAGLAVGLTVAAGAALPEQRSLITSLVVPGVLLFEIVGPLLTASALRRAGEVQA
ncbi:MAG: hypothetical protein NUW23_16170, partial [Firmicutes bacterium]|nr:hypothetical protein [Bacillota bacterium]